MPQKSDPVLLNALEESLVTASAKAVILLKSGQIRLTAGSLSLVQFESAAGVMRRYWPDALLRQLNRFVVFPLNTRFWYLYAKPLLEEEDLLGLVFPLQTPLVRLRQDMTHFMHLLLKSGLPQIGEPAALEQSLQFSGQTDSKPDSEATNPVLQKGWQKEVHLEINPAKRKSVSDTMKPRPDHLEQSPESLAPPWQPLDEILRHEEDLVSILQDDFELREPPATPTGWQISPPDHSSEAGIMPMDVEPLSGETSPQKVEPQPETWKDAVSTVTFYLVPGNDRHFLVGDLGQRLRRWVPEICETYGWQLDHLSLRPSYLKWTLGDFPEVLIREMLHIIRRMTSDRIFRIFPNLKEGISSLDFWSPGYLVDTRNRELSTQALMVRLADHREPTQNLPD